MAANKPPKVQSKKPADKRKDRAAEIANTFEWLITAFILAFVFRAFVMEAFRIPTGSMADTLKGAHFRLRCPECGYKYDYGFIPGDYNMQADTIPPGPVPVQPTHCPSCGYSVSADSTTPVANGDRILVLKCIYQFLEPKRWDVVVFKNPENPSENYIKRLIGLPNEKIRIVDGDIYIDGKIAHRPAEVLKEHWMPIYNHDYRPVHPNQLGMFKGNSWRPPFDFQKSAWQIDEKNPTQLVLDCPINETSVLTYDTNSGNDFRVSYAYNKVSMRTRFPGYAKVPKCSDLMMRFYIQPGSEEGHVGITLSKYGVEYRAKLDLAGHVELTKVDGNEPTLLTSGSFEPPPRDAYTLVKFANVDHQLLFEFNGSQLAFDLEPFFEQELKLRYDDPHFQETLNRYAAVPPSAAIFGAGKLTLSHVALFRDIHYLSGQIRRAGEEPFELNTDEFFVMGDNSPNSHDGRYWGSPGVSSKGIEPPRDGVVPRYYLVGKALFVYWPSGFEFPWPGTLMGILNEKARHNVSARLLYKLLSLRWIPNIGQMRFIYGGTNGQDLPPPPAMAKGGTD